MRALQTAALTLLLACSAGGCIRKPRIELRDIKVAGMSFRRIDLVCLFEVTNPNIFDANLHSFESRLSAGGQTIAEGAAAGPALKVPAFGSRIITVATAVDLKKLSGVAREYRRGEAVAYEMTSRPVFNILGFAVPVTFKHAGKIPAVQQPRWKLKGVSIRGGAKPAFLLTFEITNPGRLDLSLEGISGSLRLAGETVVRIDETSVERSQELPGGKSVQFIVPVRLSVVGMARAAAKVRGNLAALKFDGDFKLKTPISMREMLLGK